MEEIKKMLRAVVNAQSTHRKEFLAEFQKLNKKVDTLGVSLNSRIDLLGSDLAYLEDDAPTREEYDALEKRVRKVEKKISMN